MRLIDADKIHPDVRTQRGALAISQGQIAYAPTVCDIEQIRKEILNTFLWENETEENLNDSVRKCLEIIDKYTKGEKNEPTDT